MGTNEILSKAYIVNSLKGIRFISFEEIRYFKADGSYTWIIGTKEKLLESKNIGFIEKRMLPDLFARIHYSILVNMAHITYCNWNKREVVLKDGTKLEIAIRRIPVFRKKLQLLNEKLHLSNGSL